MSQPLRIEDIDVASFGTSRAIRSRLWFINNKALEQHILGYLAKYKEKYRVKAFAFAFFGSHYHLLSQFTQRNRASFYRDFNARIAEAVRRFVPNYIGGPLFERRYSEQAIPCAEDVVNKFFYCALQAVNSGLVKNISDYPGYNSFTDSVYERARKYKVVDWGKYNAARRYNPEVSIEDYTEEYELTFERLPNYQKLSPKEYRKKMMAELKERQKKALRDFKK